MSRKQFLEISHHISYHLLNSLICLYISRQTFFSLSTSSHKKYLRIRHSHHSWSSYMNILKSSKILKWHLNNLNNATITCPNSCRMWSWYSLLLLILVIWIKVFMLRLSIILRSHSRFSLLSLLWLRSLLWIAIIIRLWLSAVSCRFSS